MTRPRLALMLAASALLAAFAGCGGDSGPDRTAGLTPDEILAQSTAASKDVTAFALAGTANAQARIVPATGLPATLLADPVRLSGEGPVNGDDASFDFDLSLSGLPAVQANLTKVGGGLYLGLLGTDYKIDLPAEQVAAVRPASLPAGLLGWVTDPVEVGREDVDGDPTIHLAGTIGVDQALDATTGILGSVQDAPVSAAELRRSRPQLQAALRERAIDVWIGTEDLLPRRFAVKARFAGTVAAVRQLRTANVAFDLRLSKYGEATEIPTPQTTEVLDLDQLGELTNRG